MAALLLEAGVLFAVVAVAGALASRLGQSVIPFYILSGVVAGPYVAGELGLPAVETNDFVEVGAELGIVFLLFFLGLEFSLSRLVGNRRRIGAAGTVDLLNLVVGFLLGYAVLGDPVAAVLVAGIVYISSSAIITKSLIDLGWIANDESEPMLGVLVYEDLFIAVYLAVVSALVTGTGELTDAVFDVGVAVGFIVALLVVVYAGSDLFDRLLDVRSNEAKTLRAVGVTVLVAGTALALGVSEAVAAFFVGMAFSGTGHVEEIENLLSPVRDVFAAVFFFWIGVTVDPSLIVPVAGLLVAAVVVTTPVKFATGFAGGRVYDLSARRSTRVGLGMTTRGEFSLVIAAVAAGATGAFDTPLVTETVPAFAVAYVLVMSILGTSLMRYSSFFEDAVSRFTEKS
ncbi:MAG: cation:proton antiporter [Halobacteria archaeon]